MAEEVDDFLMHFGVKGMKWGQRKSSIDGEHRSLSPEAKKALKASAIAVGGATVLVGAIYASRVLGSKSSFNGPQSKLAIESGEKLVSKLINSASARPAFSVSVKGVTSKTGHNPLKEVVQLRKKVGKMDNLNETVNFLRNESNVPLRVGNARFLGDLFTSLSNDPNVSTAEAARRMGATREIMNNSLRAFTQ